MPPESDAESVVEEVVNEKSGAVQAQVDQELNDAVEAPQAEDDEDEEEDDGEMFVVEKILRHHDDFDDGEMRYEIKWKGYEKAKDRTWETEDNLEGAREILEAYWASIGGKPTRKPKPAPKKRGRQSTGSQIEPAKKQKRGRKSAPVNTDLETTPEPPIGYSDVNPDTWKPPAPNDNAWDPLIMNVDTIEKDNEGELWAYLVWNEKNEDGRFNRSKARLVSSPPSQLAAEIVILTSTPPEHLSQSVSAEDADVLRKACVCYPHLRNFRSLKPMKAGKNTLTGI
ncbi:MAG: hypothetical protein Q9219_004466 [cf. Caloplaca sp. 3 TL-2023]